MGRVNKTEAVPVLVVLSGPSGVGKDALLSRMKQVWPSCHYAVTATTRPQRAGEKNGIDYYFLSESEFQQLKEEKGLLEWAQVYGQWYGIPRREIKKALEKEQDVVIKVDVQGAATVRRLMPQAVLIFVAPPSFEELEHRLRQRSSESEGDLKLRIEQAKVEMQALPLFDYVVVNYNDKLDLAISQIQAIITAEKCRLRPRE